MSPRTPLLDPEGYFTDRPDPFLIGAGVLALHVIVDLALVSLLIDFMLSEIDGITAAERSQVRSELNRILFLAIIVYLIAWLVVAAVMHFGVGGSSAEGTYGDALGVAGWAYAPEVLAAVPTYLYARQVIGDLSLDASEPGALEAEAEALAAGATSGPLVVLLLVVTVWSVYILAKGVSETHNVALGRAMLPAVVVGVGSILLTLAG